MPLPSSSHYPHACRMDRGTPALQFRRCIPLALANPVLFLHLMLSIRYHRVSTWVSTRRLCTMPPVPSAPGWRESRGSSVKLGVAGDNGEDDGGQLRCLFDSSCASRTELSSLVCKLCRYCTTATACRGTSIAPFAPCFGGLVEVKGSCMHPASHHSINYMSRPTSPSTREHYERYRDFSSHAVGTRRGPRRAAAELAGEREAQDLEPQPERRLAGARYNAHDVAHVGAFPAAFTTPNNFSSRLVSSWKSTYLPDRSRSVS